MRFALLLVFLTFLYFAHGLSLVEISINRNVESKSFGLTGRIINGTKATLRQFPHQVSLMRSWNQNHFCGGNIISSKLILTAAHCMYLNNIVIQPWMIIVVGGTLKLNEYPSTRQERGVESIAIHPQFDITTLYNDVAVLQLLVSFELSPEVNYIPLPGNPPVPETICQVSGWGYTAEDVPIVSNDLMYVNLPIRSTEECRELLVNVTDLPTGMLCAGYLEGGKDSCQGDSGGGMVCNGILTGIVSGGEGCAQPRLPGIYADIFHYMDWISNQQNVIIVHKFHILANNHSTHKTPTITVVMISFFLCSYRLVLEMKNRIIDILIKY
ncbi:serine protease 1-like [Cataglyphis hispanica]|uniref:serine protease 1-like n=1 Tax=Cataglyphis hispanica TaxID=1086592 RepID=UPI0021806BBF|nr:serine protease 1-like [Cataglyphis hispanica]